MAAKVFVSGIPRAVSKQDFEAAMRKQLPSLAEVVLLENSVADGLKNKGFGFVIFEGKDIAQAALAAAVPLHMDSAQLSAHLQPTEERNKGKLVESTDVTLPLAFTIFPRNEILALAGTDLETVKASFPHDTEILCDDGVFFVRTNSSGPSEIGQPTILPPSLKRKRDEPLLSPVLLSEALQLLGAISDDTTFESPMKDRDGRIVFLKKRRFL